MAKSPRPTYRIKFHNHNKIYELYAHEVAQSDMAGFIEIGEIIFGEHTKLLIDPAEVADTIAAGRSFLEETLEANQDAEWRILIHHRAMFSAGEGHGSATDLQHAWGRLLDDYNVDLV